MRNVESRRHENTVCSSARGWGMMNFDTANLARGLLTDIGIGISLEKLLRCIA